MLGDEAVAGSATEDDNCSSRWQLDNQDLNGGVSRFTIPLQTECYVHHLYLSKQLSHRREFSPAGLGVKQPLSRDANCEVGATYSVVS